MTLKPLWKRKIIILYNRFPNRKDQDLIDTIMSRGIRLFDENLKSNEGSIILYP